MTQAPFAAHFDSLVKEYHRVTIVDLLQDKRKREEVLTKEYFQHYIKSPLSNAGKLGFVHFDFHRLCKGGNFENLKLLTD